MYHTSMSREAQLYEIGMLIRPELAEQEAAEVLGTVRSYVEQKNGIIESTIDPKMRQLGYPVQKAVQAYFAAIQFMVNPSVIAEVGRDITGNDRVLRHMIFSWKKESPRPAMRRHIDEGMWGNAPSTPVAEVPGKERTAEEKQVAMEEIDKRLDEILAGKE